MDGTRQYRFGRELPLSEKNIIGKPLGLPDPRRKARDMPPISVQQKTCRNDRMSRV